MARRTRSYPQGQGDVAEGPDAAPAADGVDLDLPVDQAVIGSGKRAAELRGRAALSRPGERWRCLRGGQSYLRCAHLHSRRNCRASVAVRWTCQVVPSRPVMPIVNRPVPELKEGWLSASALNEPDFVSFAMVFAVYATAAI
jgi:hypothetical protein